MKDFEDMTAKEKEEILKQLQNLPEDSRSFCGPVYTII